MAMPKLSLKEVSEQIAHSRKTLVEVAADIDLAAAGNKDIPLEAVSPMRHASKQLISEAANLTLAIQAIDQTQPPPCTPRKGKRHTPTDTNYDS